MEKNKEYPKEVKIYSIELAVFALIYLVLGVLILVSVIPLKGTFRHILIYVSLVASAWFIFDFFWTLFSQKRRKKSSLFDKTLLLPAIIGVVVVDILTFTMGFEESNDLHVYFTGAVLCYFALIFVIEAFYHLKHPLPILLEEEEEEKESKKKAEANLKVNNSTASSSSPEDMGEKLKALEMKQTEEEKKEKTE